MTLDIINRPAGADCAAILADLPEWFGIPKANAAYIERAEGDQTWVAEVDGRALGLMVLADQGFAAIDIHFLAVRRDVHRQGVGKALVMLGRLLRADQGLARGGRDGGAAAELAG